MNMTMKNTDTKALLYCPTQQILHIITRYMEDWGKQLSTYSTTTYLGIICCYSLERRTSKRRTGRNEGQASVIFLRDAFTILCHVSLKSYSDLYSLYSLHAISYYAKKSISINHIQESFELKVTLRLRAKTQRH